MIPAPPWEVAVPDMITTAISLLVACPANRYITPEFTALRRESIGLHGAHGALTWAIFSDVWPCLIFLGNGTIISHVLGMSELRTVLLFPAFAHGL